MDGDPEVRVHTLCGFSECRGENASRYTSENHSLYRPASPLPGSLGSGSHPTRTPPHPLHSPFPGRRREPHPDGVRLFAAADAEAFRVPGTEYYSPRLGIEGCNWRMVGAERDCFTYLILAVRMRNSDRRRQYAVSRRRRVESASATCCFTVVSGALTGRMNLGQVETCLTHQELADLRARRS